MKYYRKIIRITAEMSPNVRLALEQVKRGIEPTNTVVVPGVLTYEEYVNRRKHWDKIRQCIGLDAAFYEGPEDLLYPPTWLNDAEGRYRWFTRKVRIALGVGIDSDEGGDETVFVAVDRLGVIDVERRLTPDTSVIPGLAIDFIRKWQCPHENVCFDRGGGGKEHADRLRAQGLAVRSVGFGEKVAEDRNLAMVGAFLRHEDRVHEAESKYVYKNRRAQMYGELRTLLDPANNPKFAYNPELTELRRQIAPIPRLMDGEGRMYLPPKNRRSGGVKVKGGSSSEVTMDQLIGCSPDIADALVLAVYGMLHPAVALMAGPAR